MFGNIFEKIDNFLEGLGLNSIYVITIACVGYMLASLNYFRRWDDLSNEQRMLFRSAAVATVFLVIVSLLHALGFVEITE